MEFMLRSPPAAPDSDNAKIFVFTPPAIIGSPNASISLAYFKPNTGTLVDYYVTLNLDALPPETTAKSYAEA